MRKGLDARQGSCRRLIHHQPPTRAGRNRQGHRQPETGLVASSMSLIGQGLEFSCAEWGDVVHCAREGDIHGIRSLLLITTAALASSSTRPGPPLCGRKPQASQL